MYLTTFDITIINYFPATDDFMLVTPSSIGDILQQTKM